MNLIIGFTVKLITVKIKVKIIKATLIALFVAVIILLTTILPAEYGKDYLGTGKLLGLNNLSQTNTVPAKSPTTLFGPSAPYTSIAGLSRTVALSCMYSQSRRSVWMSTQGKSLCASFCGTFKRTFTVACP
jgi:hypothetical protein